MSQRPAIRDYNTGFATGEDMLRLHLNETPYPTSAAALAAASAELGRRHSVYPDSECSRLRERIAEHLGVTPNMVAVGNGVDEMVLLAALTFLGPERTAVVTETTFPGYLTSTAVAGGRVRTVPLDEYTVDPTAVATAMRDGADVAFVCNPLNPTGTVLDAAGIEEIIAGAETAGTVAVFDEAYLDFAGPAHEHTMAAVRAGRPVLVLRTFSKAWGLAALRVGYMAGPAELIARVWHTRRGLPYNVNRLAQHAAVAALDDDGYVTTVRERTAAARDRLCAGLSAAGVPYVPSVTNFVLVRTGGDSTDLARRLAQDHRILVRDLTVFGLPGCLRVTVGTPEQMDTFCAALSDVLDRTRAGTAPGRPVPHWERAVPTLAPVDVPSLFNGYVGTHVVFALRELGTWDLLLAGPATLPTLAARAQADPVKLRALLRTAALLGHLELSGDTVCLTEAGREVVRNRGFFTWGVGGYGDLMRSLADIANGSRPWGVKVRRDETLVAAGSGEVGRELMLPVEADVVRGLDYASAADLGCGDGSRLIRLCGGDNPRRGLGIDISESACALAAKKVADAGLTDHIEIACEDVFALGRSAVFPGIELVSSFLMLHDLFAAASEPVQVVHALRRAFPDARYFLLGDTAAQPWQRHTGPLPVFSLEFELAHAFMGVPILDRDVYEQAFADGGLRIVRREPFGAPSTWIYLLATG